MIIAVMVSAGVCSGFGVDHFWSMVEIGVSVVGLGLMVYDAWQPAVYVHVLVTVERQDSDQS